MLEEYFNVTCPYCGDTFSTGKPKVPREPYEVVCVPYTRDVGRFDPKDEEEWFDPEKWSRIGSDYLAVKQVSWERIGILRVSEAGLNIRYRVQMCPECGSPFDVYVNYTKGKTLEELWRHLFSLHPKHEHEIKPYLGESWTVWIIRRLGKKLKADSLGAVLIGLLLFGLGLISLAQSGVLGQPSFNLDGRILIYGIASLSVIILLIMQETFIKYLATTDDFDTLLKIKNKHYGVNHWRNFTLARFVGVQEEGKLPRLSQVDIVSGGISIILLLLVWGAQQLKWLRSSIPVELTIGGTILDLVFWIVFAYIIGTATLMALNIALYVLQGVSRIPMNLSPYDYFSLAKPLRVLQKYSTGMMLVLFLAIIIMVTILQLAEPPASIINIPAGQLNWLLVWLRWGLAIMFAAIGLGLGRGEYLGIALFYTFLSLLFNFQITVTLGFFTFIINGPVLNLGIFFTILTGFQIFKIDDLINRLLLAAKRVELQKLREQVDTIHEQVMFINEKIHQQLDPLKNVGDPERESTIDLQMQRQTALESMESLLRIIDRVEKVPVERQPLRRIAELSAPVVTSFVFPILATEIGELI